MALLRLLAGAALSLLIETPAAAQPAQLVVQVWSFGFAPNPIHLAAGKQVTITFSNRSGSGHDFKSPGFFRHAAIISGATDGDEVELGPHETKSITLVPRAGVYQAHCSHFLHEEMGMRDQIVVD